MNISSQLHTELARVREHEIRAEAERRRQTSRTAARRFVTRSGAASEEVGAPGGRLIPAAARGGRATAPECCAS